jgi:hypothetical protein
MLDADKLVLRKNGAGDFIRIKNLLFIAMMFFYVQTVEAGDGSSANKIPSLEETLALALKYNASHSSDKKRGKLQNKEESEIVATVKQLYYDLQCKKERLKVAEEVKGYFEKAASKAEEKFEEGNTAVSQLSLTKLKLGMAGASGDIISLSSDMLASTATLGKMIGRNFGIDSEITDDKIVPLEFKFDKFDDYLNSLFPVESKRDRRNMGAEKSFSLYKAFIKVMESRDKMNLAEKLKKMTRALLVTESSNHDFGIGNSSDLFESLIIYTRVLSGYFETIYNFNMSVVELNKIAGKVPSLS